MRVVGLVVVVAACGTLQPPEAPDARDGGALDARRRPVCRYGEDAQALADCGRGNFQAVVGGRGFRALGDAVAAAAGGTVWVCPGQVTGGVDLTGPVDLQAADPAPFATTLVGGAGLRPLRIQGDARVVGLTLTGGDVPDDGGGGWFVGGEVVLECLTVQGNRAGYSGGGVFVRGDEITVNDAGFQGNVSGYEGGGMTLTAGSEAELGGVVMFENVADYEGGAVAARGDVRVQGSLFVRNTADYEGGALSWGDWTDGALDVGESTFEGNVASYEGGAVSVGTWANDAARFTDTAFDGNLAPSGSAIDFGSWGRVDAIIERGRFAGNRAASGAAIELGGWLQAGASVTIVGTDLRDNASGAGASVLQGNSRMPAYDVLAREIRVGRNTGGLAAFTLAGSGTMTCQRCTFGTGNWANSPADVTGGGRTLVGAPPDFTL